jgi:2'-5' RNA ligase
MNQVKNYVRVFVAVPVQPAQAEELKQIQLQNNSLRGIRWTPLSNLHITVFFLGEVQEENISSISKKIKVIAHTTSPFNIQFEKITTEGKIKRSGMIWARFYKNKDFSLLANTVSESVKSFLAPRSAIADPVPHITLARLKVKAEYEKINLFFKENFSIPEITFCELWQTIHTKDGVLYKSLERFDFLN